MATILPGGIGAALPDAAAVVKGTQREDPYSGATQNAFQPPADGATGF
jgi:hypothetical protein